MGKKFISILLSLVTAVSVFAFTAAAEEVTEEPAGAEVTVERSGSTGTFKFDSGDWNSNNICFYIWDSTDPANVMYATKNGWVPDNPWGSKKLRGTKVEGEDGVFESYEVDLPEGHNIYVIFHDPDTNAQTYDCVINSSAFGDTAYMTGNSIENPADSEKTAIEAVFQNTGDCGPAKVITSSGNIVGDVIAPNTDRPLTVANFIYTYWGKQEKLSGADIVTEDTVNNAISEFGTTADEVWASFQTFDGQEGKENYSAIQADVKKMLKISDGTATDSDDDDDDNSSNTSSKSGTTTTTTTSKTTTTTAKTTSTTAAAGDTTTTATGDTTGTVAFAVILLVAAAAIVVTRKKVQE